MKIKNNKNGFSINSRNILNQIKQNSAINPFSNSIKGTTNRISKTSKIDNIPYSVDSIKLLQNLYFSGYIRGYYRIPNSTTITILLK